MNFDNALIRPYWLDALPPQDARPPLGGVRPADLVVVGAGFVGLWTALRALEREPGRRVIVLEAETIASGATGRNGGFIEASVTHGLENGIAHFPREITTLERLGSESFAGLLATVDAEQIECGLERNGSIDVATEPYQVAGLADMAATAREHGHRVELLEASALRRRVDSPTYLGGLARSGTTALVDPARLALGLARAVEARGGEIFEHSPVTHIASGGRTTGSPLVCEVADAGVGARAIAERVVLATSAYPPLLRKIRRYVLPVYDYVLVTEQLDAGELSALGWSGREGLSDLGNQFHYYRLTPDNRLLFGGYDAVYYYGNGMGSRYERRPNTWVRLAQHITTTFPHLSGVSISHAWGGAIDTCSRFCAFYDTAFAGRLAYAAGFTGLGVGASRFAADVLLDLLGGASTERTELEMVRKKPMPFPPEPLRSVVVAATKRSLVAADEHEGHRNAWLRVLDALGVGFDS